MATRCWQILPAWTLATFLWVLAGCDDSGQATDSAVPDVTTADLMDAGPPEASGDLAGDGPLLPDGPRAPWRRVIG